LELAGTMKKTANRPAVVVAATAMKRGPEAAVREAEKLAADTSEQATLLQNAAQTLIRLRAFTSAAVLLERAGPLSPDTSELLAPASMLRRVRRLDQVPLPADQPSTVARKLFVIMAREKAETRDLLPLISERALGGADASQLPPALLQQVRQKIESSGTPTDLAMEIALAVMKETVSGDDQVGFRIDFRSELGGGESQQVFV